MDMRTYARREKLHNVETMSALGLFVGLSGMHLVVDHRVDRTSSTMSFRDVDCIDILARIIAQILSHPLSTNTNIPQLLLISYTLNLLLTPPLPLDTNLTSPPPILRSQRLPSKPPCKAFGNKNAPSKPPLIGLASVFFPLLDEIVLHFFRDGFGNGDV